MAVLVVVFIYTDVTAAIDTDGFQYAFLYSTLASVVVINIVVAIFQVLISIPEAEFKAYEISLTCRAAFSVSQPSSLRRT